MLQKLINFLQHLFHIRNGKERNEEIIRTIKEGVSFHGVALWELIFAILIASVGLNINSTAVIIGAMLISPLMSPILGLGLSLGINDFSLLRRSIRNISIATIVSIVISTIYFYISPLSNIQSELLARTNPTIYDVLIAFFGGFAGVVGSIKIGRNNVVPGVAIATALMPPLCTVGYGIATGQPHFFLGAFYLYIINATFICIATLLGIKYLRLPSVTYINEKEAEEIRRIISIVVILMIVPAVYFGYTTVKENNFNQNTDKYIQENFVDKGYVVIYKKLTYKSNPHTIEIALLSKHFTPTEINTLESELPQYNLLNTQLLIKQDRASLSEEEWNTAITNLKNESEKIKAIESKLSVGFFDEKTAAQILLEAQAINSNVSKIAIGNMPLIDGSQKVNATSTPNENITVVTLYIKPESKALTAQAKEVLSSWLKTRLQNENLLINFIN